MKSYNILKHYWKITKSTGFMARFILSNIYNFIPVKKWRDKLAIKSNKAFFFKTDFGDFLANTTYGWYVLGPYYESDVRKYIDNNSKEFSKEKNKICIDVGAHIGRYAIELSKNYNYKVMAFEPSPETYKLLKVNTILSGVENSIELFNCGLGSSDGQVFFEHIDGGEGCDHIITENAKLTNKKNKKIKVNIRTLDGIFEKETKFKDYEKKIRLIIMDVEGLEFEVLSGMKNTLNKASSLDVIIEIFDKNINREKTFALMKEAGFEKPTRINSENWFFRKRK